MKPKVEIKGVYVPSDNIVARVIDDELLIVPLVSRIADMDEDLFTLNETGKAIWEKLNGRNRLKDIVEALATEFDAPAGEIEKDVMGLMEELLRRRMVVEAPEG